MDNFKIPTTVLIDLSKAFDTLNHDIILSKLGYYGVSGVELRLLSNYLSDRVQYVEYLGAISQSRSIGVGVPQGSILGPLLFLIYINDLPKSSDMFNILMYADDTTLFCNFDTTCDSEKINSELEKKYRWLCSNKLSLNVGKTKFACFHTGQRIVAYPELKTNNFIIDRVTEFKFLGLIISSNMKWKKHIDHIALKVSKIIGIMHRLKFILPADVLLTIYNSLILPHFNYCHLAWGSNITARHKLHLLQKMAVRIVDHRHFLAHTEPICKRLRIVKIVDMFQISIWKFYYKLMNNMLPSYFEYMKPVQPVACNYYGIRKPRLHCSTLLSAIDVKDIGLCDDKGNLVNGHYAITCTLHHHAAEIKSKSVSYRQLKGINTVQFKQDIQASAILTLYSALYTFVYTKSNTSPHSIQHAHNISYLLYQ